MMKKKLLMIILGILLITGIVLLIVFSGKSKKENKIKEDENNYSINFTYYTNDKVSQKVKFIYRDKILKDITITLYLSDNGVASGVYKEYKKEGNFKKYELKKNKVILYYKDSDVKDYKSYTKEEIIQEFTALGYVYKE